MDPRVPVVHVAVEPEPVPVVALKERGEHAAVDLVPQPRPQPRHPLVELRTTSLLRFVTDNAGLIVLDEPELMNREVWFTLYGHGYEVPKDGFGIRGVRTGGRSAACGMNVSGMTGSSVSMRGAS